MRERGRKERRERVGVECEQQTKIHMSDYETYSSNTMKTKASDSNTSTWLTADTHKDEEIPPVKHCCINTYRNHTHHTNKAIVEGQQKRHIWVITCPVQEP